VSRPVVAALLEIPAVLEWHSKVALKSKATAGLYLQSLSVYWRHWLSRRFASIPKWLEFVKESQRAEDVKTRRSWGTDLETFLHQYISTRTKRHLTSDTRNVIASAVRSFLENQLGDVQSYSITLADRDQLVAEAREREERLPLSVDEVKQLYNACRTTRDRAIISSLIVGFGISEWLQFAHDWSKYREKIKAKTVPVEVSVTRHKTGITYFVLLWDDCVEDLRTLIQERERELQRPLHDKDPLFVNQTGEPISDAVVQSFIRHLADRSGLESKEPGKLSYRIRPHELGRDFFRTLCEIHEVSPTIAEFSLGHKIDPLEYNRFHKTRDGRELIIRQLSRLRPILNLRTGKGEEKVSGERECCRLAATLAIQLHISEEEAHNRMLNDLYKNHKDLFQEIMARLKAAQTAEYAAEGKGHYDHLQMLNHEERVMLAVEVASTNGNGNKHEIRKVPDDDVEAYAQAIADGFEEKGRINGTIIMRKGFSHP